MAKLADPITLFVVSVPRPLDAMEYVPVTAKFVFTVPLRLASSVPVMWPAPSLVMTAPATKGPPPIAPVRVKTNGPDADALENGPCCRNASPESTGRIGGDELD